MTQEDFDPMGLEDAAVQELGTRLRGAVLVPGNEGYDAARKVWNGMIDKHPAVIVRCTGVTDVLAAVEFARDRHLVVAVHGGGHNVAGNAVCDGGLMIDLSPMKGIRVDPLARTVRAQGGVTWGELDRETQAFGLATTGGLISTTGIAGLTLGGGIGWLARKHGLACDNLLAADVITADERYLQVSAEEHRDLYWAIRGGGGNFGIVTAFEYRLHTLGQLVTGGLVLHPFERAREVLRFYRDYIAAAPDALSAFPAFIIVPPLPQVPATLHGSLAIAIAACYAGAPEDGERAVQPLRAFGPPVVDLLGPLPYTALQSLFDPSAPASGLNYWKSDYLDALSDDCIDVLVRHTAALATLSPLATVHIYPLGGAIARVGTSATAFGHRHAGFSTILAAEWFDPAQSEAHIRWVRDLWQAMRPFSTGGVGVNFLGGDEGADRVQAAYGENYARLGALKKEYDPTNFFRINQNIPPAP